MHLAVDPNSGEILASELTTNEEGDASQVSALLAQIPGPLGSVTADGAYDGEPVYQAVSERQLDPPVAVVIPPRSTAVPSPAAADTMPSQRDEHIQLIRDKGRLGGAAKGSARAARGMAAEGGRRRSATAGARSARRPCPGIKPLSAAAFTPGLCLLRRPRPGPPARC